MRFSFTQQQVEFRDVVRQVLEKECTPDDLRKAYEDPEPRTSRWATLSDMGVVGLTVPEQHGGLGLCILDLIPLLEEAGRVSLPEPLLETPALAAPLLASLGGPPVASWLHQIAAGEAIVAVAPVDYPRNGVVAG